MARANFGLVAALASGAAVLGFASKTGADVWQHHSTNNTSFVTSERMEGEDIEGIVVNIDNGDHLFAFTGVATSQFITIISGPSDQPVVVYAFDKDGKPFPEGSGYNDVTLEGVFMVIDIGADNVGKKVTFAFGHYGMMPQNGTTELYDQMICGQMDPTVVETWTTTGGQNYSGSGTYLFSTDGITGVPKVTSATVGAAVRAARVERCCD